MSRGLIERRKPRGRAAAQRAIRANSERLCLPTMVENVASGFRIASDEQIERGLLWYPTANRIAGSRAGAGMLAALSPGCSWERNVALFHLMADTADCPHPFGAQIRKARAIRNGADPLDVLNGPKERSFFHNVWDPRRHGRITVDRHAFSLALLGFDIEYSEATMEIVTARSALDRAERRTATLSDVELKALERSGVYVLAAAAYLTVARRFGYIGSAMQAITWLAWREAHAFDTGNSRNYLNTESEALT